MIDDKASLLSNLSNVTAFIKQTLDDVSWVGFYLNVDDTLILGPFNGNVACTTIKNFNGVCGKCLKDKEIQIVGDVNKLKYHIACDSASNSEVVLPLIINNEVKMVLDIDSYTLNRFTEYNDEIKNLEAILDELKDFIIKNSLVTFDKLTFIA